METNVNKPVPVTRVALPVPRRGGASHWAALGYAVLLLEQGVLCVLPMLWAALLFSETG